MIYLVGPTAVGKTALSIQLAKRYHAEILSMDSMQIYRGMDIGTAKATPTERATVVHHLLDFQSPDARFTVRDYQARAQQCAKEVLARGKLPLFVGGTGLYLLALTKDYQFGDFNVDPQLRSELQAAYQRDGGTALYTQLQAVDPQTARGLVPADRKKIIRAMEVYLRTGKPLSAHHALDQARPVKENALVLVLTDVRERLYVRIDRRVDEMLQQGLVQENQRLLQEGISPHAQAMQAIGYKEVQWYLRGLVSYAEMHRLIAQHSRNYAKRQLTWFRKVPHAQWFSRSDYTQSELFTALCASIDEFLLKIKD